MEFSNKENIPIKMKQTNDHNHNQTDSAYGSLKSMDGADLSFLSCTEIFSDEQMQIIESKQPPKQNAYPSHTQQIVYAKPLTVKSELDAKLYEDNRVLCNLVKTEQRYLPRHMDYFKTVQVEVKPHMRKIVSDWMLEVAQELRCGLEVFCLAMNLMDRFLAKQRIDKSKLQLLGAVCLFLSSKFKETSPIPSEQLVMYTDFSVTIEELREWELFVLYKLKWDLGAVTGLDYLDYTLPCLQFHASLSPATPASTVKRHAETVVTLCATHYLFSYVRPSVIAASAVAVTYRSLVHKFSQEGMRQFLDNLQKVTHVDRAEIEACSAAMLQTFPDFLTSSKPTEQDSLVNSFENSSLLVSSC